MARIRSIKPEFWIDEKVVELSPWARLLFIGMWNFADDQGYVDHKPSRIKMQIFPGDSVDVVALIAELIAAGRVVAYSSPVGPVLHVVNWHHQRVDKPAKPRFDRTDLHPVEVPPPKPPTPPTPFAEPSRDLQEHSTNTDPPAGMEDSTKPREDSCAEGIWRGSGSGGDLPPSAGDASPPPRALVVVEDPGPEPRTTQELVAWWIDGCDKRPDRSTIGQISKHIKGLLEDGFEPVHIRRGLNEWHAKEVHPSVLPGIVTHIANRGAPIRAAPAQPTRTEATFAANQQVAQRLRAIEGRGT